MNQLFLRVNAFDGIGCIIPLDNIAFIYQSKDGTKIELKENIANMAAVTVAETIDEVKEMLEGSR